MCRVSRATLERDGASRDFRGGSETENTVVKRRNEKETEQRGNAAGGTRQRTRDTSPRLERERGNVRETERYGRASSNRRMCRERHVAPAALERDGAARHRRGRSETEARAKTKRRNKTRRHRAAAPKRVRNSPRAATRAPSPLKSRPISRKHPAMYATRGAPCAHAPPPSRRPSVRPVAYARAPPFRSLGATVPVWSLAWVRAVRCRAGAAAADPCGEEREERDESTR